MRQQFLFIFLLAKLISCSHEPSNTKFIVCDLSLPDYADHCLNNGICYNLVTRGEIDAAKVFCSCPAQYTGKRCEEVLMTPSFIPFLKKGETPVMYKWTNRPIPVTIGSRSIKMKQNRDCENANCGSNEICKYFDSNMYKCPSDRMDCAPFKKASKIPICIKTGFNEVCLDSLKMGNCSTYKERYYFDAVDSTCKKFYYTGCNGNRNNFHTLTECSTTCQQQQTPIPVAPRKSMNLLMAPPQNSPNPNPDTPKCQFTCTLNCPFGFKLNAYTNCPKCECSQLRMTECGVPCFTAGTKSCAFSMRANSRPLCLCVDEYAGSYCHVYAKRANFTVEFVEKVVLDEAIIEEIRINLNDELASLLQVDRKSVSINDVLEGRDSKVIVKFSVSAPDFSTPSEFENLVEFLKYSINDNLTLHVNNQNLTLTQSNGC